MPIIPTQQRTLDYATDHRFSNTINRFTKIISGDKNCVILPHDISGSVFNVNVNIFYGLERHPFDLNGDYKIDVDELQIAADSYANSFITEAEYNRVLDIYTAGGYFHDPGNIAGDDFGLFTELTDPYWDLDTDQDYRISDAELAVIEAQFWEDYYAGNPTPTVNALQYLKAKQVNEYGCYHYDTSAIELYEWEYNNEPFVAGPKGGLRGPILADIDSNFKISDYELLFWGYLLSGGADGVSLTLGTYPNEQPNPHYGRTQYGSPDPAPNLISLAQFLRLIQFRNLGGYHVNTNIPPGTNKTPASSSDDGMIYLGTADVITGHTQMLATQLKVGPGFLIKDDTLIQVKENMVINAADTDNYIGEVGGDFGLSRTGDFDGTSGATKPYFILGKYIYTRSIPVPKFQYVLCNNRSLFLNNREDYIYLGSFEVIVLGSDLTVGEVRTEDTDELNGNAIIQRPMYFYHISQVEGGVIDNLGNVGPGPIVSE